MRQSGYRSVACALELELPRLVNGHLRQPGVSLNPLETVVRNSARSRQVRGRSQAAF
jgi:hypothetical protein